MHYCAEGQPQRIVSQSTLGHDGVTWSRNAKIDKQVTHLLGIAELHSLQHHLCRGCQNMRIALMWRHFWTKSVCVQGAQRKLRITFFLGSLWFKRFHPIQGKESCRQMVPAVRTARALLSWDGAQRSHPGWSPSQPLPAPAVSPRIHQGQTWTDCS